MIIPIPPEFKSFNIIFQLTISLFPSQTNDQINLSISVTYLSGIPLASISNDIFDITKC